MSDIHVLSRAVIMVEDHILLVYDPRVTPNHYYAFNEKFYYLPGGHIEFHESAKTALVREIEEKIGYMGRVSKFLGVIEHAWQNLNQKVCHTHEINLIFKLEVPKLTLNSKIIQQEEHVAVQWVALAELDNIDLRPKSLKQLLPQWLKANHEQAFKSIETE